MTEEASHGDAGAEESPRVEAILAPTLNLAAYQNSVPLLHELKVVNPTDQPLSDLSITLASEPAFLKSRTWRLDLLGAGQTYHLTDLDVDLDGSLLGRLTEAERAEVRFVLSDPNQEWARLEKTVELLPRNQWGGIVHMPELVAAFVRPNDSAVDRVLKKAADILRQHGKSPALDGYAQGARHAWELASAVWAAVGTLGLDYALPPASFEQSGQKIRSPSQILEAGLATCMDLTLLFCSALEQCGLNSVLVFTRGHALAGVWLKDEQFASVVTDDVTALRKRVKQLNELVLFETTLATQRPLPRFSKAVESGAQQITPTQEDRFEIAVDVRRARMQRIRPLASDESAAQQQPVQAPEEQPSVFEEAPDLPEEEVLAPETTEKPESPESRLDKWQRKLLDLSLRNRLLNHRMSRRAVRLEAPDPGRLEDILAEGVSLRLVSQPELMEGHDQRNRVIHEKRTHEDVRRAYALDALKRKEVVVNLRQEELDARLTELYRSARASLQEGGANTLFLALGFLSWTREAHEERRYRAPLILLPVTLQRKSVRSGFKLALHEDEPRFNPTLLEMLRQDFGLTIPVAEGELPKDDSGLDVRGIWRSVAASVKDVRGWEVEEEVVLSTFSFAKYLMWKDLVDRTDQLRQNPVVRHLIDSPREPYPAEVTFPCIEKLDDDFHPESIFCPLPADSSQLAAVVAAAQGKDFVLVGPPGTGKSQTIANMIAQCLAHRKSVLFVSEKMAALDVVYRRLRDVGLGDFCLEIHSNKARKLDVLEQLRKAWEARGSIDGKRWRREAERLDGLRRQLNAYVRHLHRRHRNGLRPFVAIGRVVAGRDLPDVPLSWPSADAHDEVGLDGLRDLANRLDVNAQEIGDLTGSPLAVIAQAEWSPHWQQSLITAAQELVPAAEELERAAHAFFEATGLPEVAPDAGVRAALRLLAETLPQAAGRDWRFALAPDAKTIGERLRQGLTLLALHRETSAALSVHYANGVLALDLAALRTTWKEAEHAWFLRAWKLRRSVRRALATYAEDRCKSEVGPDLDRLQELQELERQLEGLGDLASRTAGLWSGLETRVSEVEAALRFQEALGRAIAGLATTPQALGQIGAALERLLGAGNALLEPPGAVATTADRILSAIELFQQRLDTFVTLVGNAPDTAQGMDGSPGEIAAVCKDIIGLQTKLHAWCAWRKTCVEAASQGLTPLVEALEQGAVAPGMAAEVFETAYCRWWINAVVEGDEVLRGFVSAEHEKRIGDFKKLDQRFTELTRDYIRANLCAEIPDRNEVERGTDWGLLRREMEKKRRHMPLRQLLAGLPEALPRLAPCLLMSPLSTAQYLAADAPPFDVVIFDEASQIPVWDAVGAIARGRQVVIVGDPKQLPPTTFFDRADADEDEDHELDSTLESILDECLGANLPAWHLHWHYRSRHESLIAFSNHRYYQGRLVTFPSPVTEDRAVSLQLVADGVYEKGGARVNKPEARALVADLVGHLKDPRFQAARLTAGVVTFNAEQQRLIEDLLDEERRRAPEIEPYFAEDAQEPVFVKNLENVQGDERDLIYFSITYGPDDRAGAISMNFGPMNRDGGERRLNVAVTRARRELRVFSSLRPDQIDLSRTQALGVRDLKHFLEFAERGPRALAEAVFGSVGEFESPFEQAVAEALARKGWQVHPQVGVSEFRIDLGVVHPEAPGRYLAGIECDGATYHRSATARDRDKLREQVLRGLGWEILRIWSTDWWHDRDGSLEKLHRRLEKLLAESRKQRAEEEAIAAPVADVAQPDGTEEGHAEAVGDDPPATSSEDPQKVGPGTDLFRGADLMQPLPYAKGAHLTESDTSAGGTDGAGEPGADGGYREADLSTGVQPDHEAFFDPAYDATLLAMIAHVVGVEGPVREDVLAKRIARAHGWARTGARIRERVGTLARSRFKSTQEDVGVFFWPEGVDTSHWPRFRRPASGEPRAVDEIAMPELVALAREVQGLGLAMEDGLTTMAREAGLKKLRQVSRSRLEKAWREVENTPSQ